MSANRSHPNPPFIWPEARSFAGVKAYTKTPPAQDLFSGADLISGLIVGAADKTIQWLDELLKREGKWCICLVLVLFPAGPTREEHLKKVHALKNSCPDNSKVLEIRLLPMPDNTESDHRRAVLPPTLIQAHNCQTDQTFMSIGSVGDAGYDETMLGSLNLVFQPDDATRDAWRRWFEYVRSCAAPLTPETMNIPHLVPAIGDYAATELWEAFEQMCLGGKCTSKPTVDPETGEITTDANGVKVQAWDERITALDPLALVFQEIYAKGWLVTVDEGTRIKPLTIPVKATLLGQQSERNVGALKQKQSFSLQVLDDGVNISIEKCRKVTDVMELLSFPLSQGNRWLPETAKALLEEELTLRNTEGQKALREALGGDDIGAFISKRTASIRADLNDMYQQLGQGNVVPENKLQGVLYDIKQRLQHALEARITPRVVYNRIGPPDLTAKAPDENWNQPLSLLLRAAKNLRESKTDSYFPRKLKGLSFSDEDFLEAMNVFDDTFTPNQSANRTNEEEQQIKEIVNAKISSKEKCQQIWSLIHGA